MFPMFCAYLCSSVNLSYFTAFISTLNTQPPNYIGNNKQLMSFVFNISCLMNSRASHQSQMNVKKTSSLFSILLSNHITLLHWLNLLLLESFILHWFSISFPFQRLRCFNFFSLPKMVHLFLSSSSPPLPSLPYGPIGFTFLHFFIEFCIHRKKSR